MRKAKLSHWFSEVKYMKLDRKHATNSKASKFIKSQVNKCQRQAARIDTFNEFSNNFYD